MGRWRAHGSYAGDVAREANRLDAVEFARWWQETGEYELRQILHWKWDPIGISGVFPYAADEYDSYAPTIAAALSRGESTEGIAALLSSNECERMRLDERSPDARQKLAADILAWFESSQIRWLEFGPLGR
ncbi:hypothetical protein BB737_01955 [Mycobacterium avium subsp. hominissuis]|uniref:Uncharacterized protein n=1 Tax=Mycobacterium avium subsp. hominissuis TaxID=439334 RepID=A0A2A3LER2_MYCAV|nr:hypothetical protein XV03_00405 [Mycobacterium avium subsp. hominissuis]PBJ67450.1 hypothetical protein BB737_01955 [Mycobacterium avium subsp. hominissuis]